MGTHQRNVGGIDYRGKTARQFYPCGAISAVVNLTSLFMRLVTFRSTPTLNFY